jgi:hypothetical protein
MDGGAPTTRPQLRDYVLGGPVVDSDVSIILGRRGRGVVIVFSGSFRCQSHLGNGLCPRGQSHWDSSRKCAA